MEARSGLIAIVGARYDGAERAERSRILDEFGEISGYYRKYAVRLQSAADAARSPHDLS